MTMNMNVPSVAVVTRGDRLCVTPHEDEGYLSPSEEDLKKSYLSKGQLRDCKSANLPDLRLSLSSRRTKSADGGRLGVGGGGDGDEEDDIPWEKLAVMPDIHIREEHLGWDRLKLPVPYRFYDEHRLCLRQVRKAPQVSYMTDSIEKHAEVVDNVWRLSGLDPEDRGEGEDAGVVAVTEIKSRKECLTYISTKQFVKDVFHLLCGRESMSFSHIPGKHFTFMKNPNILVSGLSPGLLVNISTSFLSSGKIFKRLSHISALHFDEKVMEREGLQSNPVFAAFLKFTSDYLKLYQTSLMVKASKIHSIGSLNVFYKPFYYQLQTLEWILDLYISTDQITLLKGLNSMMLTCETPFVTDLIRNAFISCAAVYLRYVSEWIFRGQITKGFHIQRTKSFTYQDRRYWVKQFSQVASVPAFMEDSANAIFETGKAINLLTLIRNKEPSTAIISCVLHDDSSIIRPAVEFKAVVALENEWKIKVESFFEEYSFLQADVEAALMNAGEEKKNIIDFDAVEEAKLSFEAKNLERRRNLYDKKVAKQKKFLQDLNDQVAEKQCREKQEKEKGILEDEKISKFIKNRDQRDLQEETRLMKKHFGERISETVGVRNVKERIAASADATDAPPSQISAQQENETTMATDLPVDENQLSATTFSDLVDLDPVLGSHDARGKEGAGEEVSCTFSPSQKAKQVYFSLDKRAEEMVDNKVNNNTNEGLDAEESFNSDNLRVLDPVPYNLNLELDAFATGGVLSKSILNFSSSILTNQDGVSGYQSNKDDEPTFRHDSFCLNFFLNQSLAAPVEAQNRMINSTLLHYFMVEKRLFQHVEALNSYLCLQNGMFGHFLTNLLIQEVKSGTLCSKEDIPRKVGRLNELLGEAVALSTDGAGRDDIRDHLGFIMMRESNRNSVDLDSQKSVKSRVLESAYEVLNNLTMNYSVEWPLSILLTEDLLFNYEKLFTFQVRLYRAELLLLSLSSFLKFKGSKSRQIPVLHHYRYRMLHFVRAVRHYINVTVIHCAWTDLASSFHKMNSLDKLYEGLVRHIKSVTTNCLLGTKGEGVKKLLLDQLTVIECFCKDVEDYNKGVRWDSGGEIPPRYFARLDQKYKVWEEIQKVFIQVFFKLANKGTYPKVSYFLQLFNFNHYFGSNLTE